MKKFLRYTCSHCKRSADRLVDNVRATPDKCTITFKCEGRLFPVQYRSDGGITATPEVGIVDWRARGTTATTRVAEQAQTFLDMATGTTQQIVIAARLTTEPGPTAKLVLKLNQRSNSPQNFKAYVYRLDKPFSTVSGVESSLEKKTLRYGPTDAVEVYLNGVKQELGTDPTQYQIYTGTSPVPTNTIGFNSPISLPGITQVDVIVTPIVPTTQTTLTFNRTVSDESRLTTGSWENASKVQKFEGTAWRDWYLFSLDLADVPDLTLNTIMTADELAVIDNTTIVPTVDLMFLLARKPYSTLDRYANLVVPLTTLTFERDYIKHFAVDGKPVLYVTETSKQTVYPPLRVVKFQQEETLKTPVAGITNQIVVDGNVIVGPDA